MRVLPGEAKGRAPTTRYDYSPMRWCSQFLRGRRKKGSPSGSKNPPHLPFLLAFHGSSAQPRPFRHGPIAPRRAVPPSFGSTEGIDSSIPSRAAIRNMVRRDCSNLRRSDSSCFASRTSLRTRLKSATVRLPPRGLPVGSVAKGPRKSDS